MNQKERIVLNDFKTEQASKIADAKAADEFKKAKSGKVNDQQKRFIEIVSAHADKYKNAKNQIKKSIIRKKRK